jgi:Lon-like ATP-dependent protease
MLQFLMEQESTVERAVIMHHLLRAFREEYMKKWEDISSKNKSNAQSAKQAKEQIDELYEYLKKLQDESSSPIKKMVLKKVRKSLETKKYSPEMKEIIKEELEKFQEISENYPEFQNIKDFLELVCDLPYGVESKDNFDLQRAKKVLDEDHFGMEKVKEKILEFIAVSKLRGTTKGKNILLVGPPGTGKTSIASSIAKCLGREFARISLGGESDVALIKGHRKTYIGAYPGKLVTALKQAKTENPVILLDEMDKISAGYKGNIQDTLLEVLDPAQNHSFRDNYLEAPLDLSKVLFICSANLLDTISPPLLDRVEIIELSSYTMSEKKAIARNYLIPKTLKSKGLEGHKVTFSDETLDALFLGYAREAGVRSLEKRISRICEKICLKIVKNNESEFDVKKEQLQSYLGPPTFASHRLYEGAMPQGVSIGLGYNSFGGSVLFIETCKASFGKPSEVATKETGKPEENEKGSSKGGLLTITGSLGKVMQESIQIAHTFAKSLCHEMFDNKYLEENNIHIHFPEGASKKDGPSAGITITTALLSLALNKAIKADVGMTGEISLNGKVLKIGGLREKVLAAKREGLKEIVVPETNKADIDELKQEITEGISFHYVSEYQQVLRIMFSLPAPAS